MALREWQGRRSTWSSGHGAELQLSLVQHTAQCWHNICTSARAFSQISAEVGDAQTSGSAPSTARFHQWAFGSLSGGTEVPLLPLPATFFQVGHASLLAQPLLQPDPTAIPPLTAALLDCTMLFAFLPSCPCPLCSSIILQIPCSLPKPLYLDCCAPENPYQEVFAWFQLLLTLCFRQCLSLSCLSTDRKGGGATCWLYGWNVEPAR